MKKMIQIAILFFIVTGCSVTEDCFKKTGDFVLQTIEVRDFDKIVVEKGVSLVIKEGPDYLVQIYTGANLVDDIQINVVDGTLQIRDKSECNLVRDYGQTIVYITTPTLIEIHSFTEKDIVSDGVLTFPILRLITLEEDKVTGTGDFRLNLQGGQLVVESNTLAGYFIEGEVQELLVNFYSGDGKFVGPNLHANTIKVFHRSSNNLILYPTESVIGDIYGNGNIVLKNIPAIIQVTEHYTGKVIIEE
jgi:hypothetical protein